MGEVLRSDNKTRLVSFIARAAALEIDESFVEVPRYMQHLKGKELSAYG